MCTLTFLAHYDGYELWFNRDEQRTRALASSPELHEPLGAIYPVDPQGQGTWLAVSQTGVSLALLNFYQPDQRLTRTGQTFTSRGQLILNLLGLADINFEVLANMDLSIYRPFVLAIFPSQLSISYGQVLLLSFDGVKLTTLDPVLPITSSSVDVIEVIEKRQAKFVELVDQQTPKSHQFKRFHFSKVNKGRQSVNMSREDAHTVSMSHIKVDANSVYFDYFDNVTKVRSVCRGHRHSY